MIDRKHVKLPKAFRGSPSSELIARAAIDKGLTLTVVAGDIFLVEGNGRAEYFEQTMAGSMSHIAKTISWDKPLTKHFFARNGVATPQGLTFTPRQVGKAAEFMRASGCKAFVKPTDGVLGDGVFLNIDSEEKLRARCAQFQKRKPLLIEEQVEGTECRYFAVGDQVVAVAERRPASVLGDGERTVAELVARKNASRAGHLALSRIEIDGEAGGLLAEQGLTLETVPAEGQAVRLKRVSSISQGGDSVDMTDLVHDDLKALAVSALQAIPTMLYAGIDVIAENHMTPLAGQRAVVLELNWHPMLRIHHAPAVGQPRDVAGAIIDHLFFR